MNWIKQPIPRIKFKVYDPELKQFFVDEEIAHRIKCGGNPHENMMKRYFLIYGEAGFGLGFYGNGGWRECIIFPYSGFRDRYNQELYMFDRIKHTDGYFSGQIEMDAGVWIIKYANGGVVPIDSKCGIIAFHDHPDVELAKA